MVRKLLSIVSLVAVVAVGSGVVQPSPASAEGSDAWVQGPLSIAGTYQPLVGDFNGDASDDILWYNPDSLSQPLWIGRAGRRDPAAFQRELPSVKGDYRPFVGDFAGDEVDDIFWYAPGAKADVIWVGARGARASFGIQGAKQEGTGTPYVLHDRTGGKDDILWYTPGRGADELWIQRDTKAGPDERIPVRIDGSYQVLVGDWNGDGQEEPFWYAPGRTPDYRWISQPDGRFASWPNPVNGTYSPVVLSPRLTTDDPFDDIFWSGPGSRGSSQWLNIDGHFTPRPINSFAYGTLGRGVRIPAPATGTTDAIFPRSTAGDVSYWAWSGATRFTALGGPLLNVTSQQPLVGDFDDDGSTDIVWYGAGSVPDAIWYGNAA